jgi:hypothetical protein
MVNLFTKRFMHKMTFANVPQMIRRKEHIGKAFYSIGSTTEIDGPNDSSWTMRLKEQPFRVSSIERNAMNWTDGEVYRGA